ncbi:MAG: discoidin domain-containing protein, partial [Oscillospiraceae bacterium]|nr:discoidin domain-containing protein [Oscillospiraceae bacterium]
YAPQNITASSDYTQPNSAYGGPAPGGAQGKAAAFNEDMRSWWSAATGTGGEWIQADFGKTVSVNAFQINFADQDTTAKNNLRDNDWIYRYLLEFSPDGVDWYTLLDKSDAVAEPNKAQDCSHDYFELAKSLGVRCIRLTNKGSVPAGGKFAVSGIRLFGHGGGEAPAKQDDFTVVRNKADERQATVSWTAVPGAQGYIVCYGSREGAQHLHYQVIGGTSVTVRNLTLCVDYWFTVDTYNDSGYTKGTVVKPAPWTVPPLVTPDAPQDPVPKDTAKYPLYEAEDARLYPMSGGPAVADDPAASGGKSVQGMHEPGVYIEFTNIEGGPGGEGKLWLVYACGVGNSLVNISVNGTALPQTFLHGTGGWSNYKGVEIPIFGLTPGKTNTVRLAGAGIGFNPDYIQVIY